MAYIQSGKSFNKDNHQKKMKNRMENMDSVQYPLRIPSHIYKKLKIKAAQESVTLRSILLDMLIKYLDK